MKAAKLELDDNSILLMDRKFVEIPKVLNSITQEKLGEVSMFQFPFNTNVLQLHYAKDFKGIPRPELEKLVN